MIQSDSKDLRNNCTHKGDCVYNDFSSPKPGNSWESVDGKWSVFAVNYATKQTK